MSSIFLIPSELCNQALSHLPEVSKAKTSPFSMGKEVHNDSRTHNTQMASGCSVSKGVCKV